MDRLIAVVVNFEKNPTGPSLDNPLPKGLLKNISVNSLSPLLDSTASLQVTFFENIEPVWSVFLFLSWFGKRDLIGKIIQMDPSKLSNPAATACS